MTPMRMRSNLAVALTLAAMVAGLVSLIAPAAQPYSAFLQPATKISQRDLLTGAAAAGAAAFPLPALASQSSSFEHFEQIGSSVAVADLAPLENPSLGWIVLLSMFSMSIALVVWGRNGF
eukprot:TRINITY_DN7905_c0_g1_i3.p1 TRINITY_DN7905_c0_g1~~TRINITY_DN7905_c0_g1_i3.p1  ORF type:complete len:120 (+),score=21.81 TRINITY_DN7905_c0_g1_i3:79-438(+)